MTRLSAGQRRTLQIVGIVLVVAGGGLFILGPVQLFTGLAAPAPGDDGWFGDTVGRLGTAALLSAIGGFLMFVGAVAAQFGFMKPMSEITATETSGAIEHASGAFGRGLASAGMGGGAPEGQIRVRCRACGSLDTEDARFCSSCGQAM